MDGMIAAIVQQKKPVQGEKGQYGYVRRAEEKPRKSRKKLSRNPEPLNTEEEFIGSMENRGEGLPGMADIISVPGVSGIRGMPDMSDSNIYSTVNRLHAVGPGPLDRPAMNAAPAEEEMDETDEGSQWEIRIGNDAPPQWAKRKAEEAEEDSLKRQRTL